MKAALVLVSSALLSLTTKQATATSSDFFECEHHLSSIITDHEAKEIMEQVVQEGNKLSSACLQHCLQRNFFTTANYLIDSYYQHT